jgi:hypothetical protein
MSRSELERVDEPARPGNLATLAATLLLGAAFFPAAAWAAWPSLDRQLSKDRVRPGTALARLIAANQDFSLLRDSEQNDHIPLPPWLRVLWRKGHPGAKAIPGDPTGGYPLVLREAHEWMITHQDLVPGQQGRRPGAAPPGGEREAAVAGKREAAAAVGEPKIATSGGDERISGAQFDPRSESSISVNPWDATKIIAASNNIGGNGAQAQYFSTDGGVTWGQTTVPLVLIDAFDSDPTVDWTSDGTAWSVTIGIDAFLELLELRAYKSTDNGATWTFDATVSGDQGFTDKEILWGDHSSASPYKDNLYVIWHNGFPVYISRRAGGSWQTPIRVSGLETLGTGIGGDVKTNSAGMVFGTWPDTGGQAIWTVRSADGGASFSAPVKVANTFGSFDIGIPADDYRRALIYASTGAFKDSSHDDVYVTWTDLSGAPGCTVPADEPGYNPFSTCKTRIWFASSSDGGVTWSAPKTINDQPSLNVLNDQFFPWLNVDPNTGALGVVYYDTVADPGRVKTDVWYQSSFDGGQTWRTPIKVTTAQTDETSGFPDFNQYGDYIGLSGYAGRFFPSWTDRRNLYGLEEIWTAGIEDPICPTPGAPAIGTATAINPNQIQVTWGNGSPASSQFNVYHAIGACASHGVFTAAGTALVGSPFTDTSVSGTVTYAYEVTGLDATGNCESARSACVEATATGVCTLPPNFAGVAAVTDAGASSCTLDVSWAPATPICSGPATYNVYRSSNRAFVPNAGDRVAAGVSGTSFADSTGINGNTKYYYMVRAVDVSNGAEDGNTALASARPTGPVAFADTFEGSLSGLGFDNAGWTHSALSSGFDWELSTDQSQTPTHSWFSVDRPTTSERVLVSPPLAVQAGMTLAFWHTYAFEGDALQCYDGGTLETSIDGGATWTVFPAAAFRSGGFTGTANPFFGNPIGGRQAWCGGLIGAMTEVVADLSSFAGQSLQLRWHEGDDLVYSVAGWYVDSVSVTSSCQASPPPALQFYTLTPCRVIDTRGAAGPLGAPALQPFGDRLFALAGSCGVPVDAKAVSLNVTVTEGTAAGDLRLYPGDLATPQLTSNINYVPGQTRANNAVLSLGQDGLASLKVRCDSAGTVEFILDVNGYFK